MGRSETHIYQRFCSCDPTRPRYGGKTFSDLPTYLSRQLKDASRLSHLGQVSRPVDRWMLKHTALGHVIGIRNVETVTTNWEKAERSCIASIPPEDRLNLTLGGDSSAGRIPSLQQRAKQSESIRAAYKLDPTIGDRIAQSLRDRCRAPVWENLKAFLAAGKSVREAEREFKVSRRVVLACRNELGLPKRSAAFAANRRTIMEAIYTQPEASDFAISKQLGVHLRTVRSERARKGNA